MVGSSSTLKKSCILSTQVVLVLALSSLVAVAQTHKNQPPKPCAERLSTIKPELDWPKNPVISDCVPFNLETVFAPELVYPKTALAVRATGSVSVEVVIDKKGRVIWMNVLEGHPLLRQAALEVTCKTRFKPIRDCLRRKLKMYAVLNYNFKP